VTAALVLLPVLGR